jgi:hypothetical protein
MMKVKTHERRFLSSPAPIMEDPPIANHYTHDFPQRIKIHTARPILLSAVAVFRTYQVVGIDEQVTLHQLNETHHLGGLRDIIRFPVLDEVGLQGGRAAAFRKAHRNGRERVVPVQKAAVNVDRNGRRLEADQGLFENFPHCPGGDGQDDEPREPGGQN